MKITHFVPQIEKQSSGYAYTVPKMCKTLSDMGHLVKLITVDGNIHSFDDKEIDFSQKTYSERQLESSSQYGSMERQMGIRSNLRSATYATASSCDILHVHSLWRMTNIFPAWAGKKYSKPFVVSPRGTLSQHAQSGRKLSKIAFNIILQNRALHSASLFHATSEAEYQDIRHNGFMTPVAIIPNGVDIPDLITNQVSNIEKTSKTLLYVGRIHPIKGLELLLDCWQDLLQTFPDWKLHIVGPIDNKYAQALKDNIVKKNVPRVHFVGEKSGLEKNIEYQRADIVVLPSFSENFGMVIAEALANGTPVIATTGTPWEKMQENGCGWWVDRETSEFSNTLEEAMMMSREALSKMGQNGRIWVQREFSWEKVAEDILKAYTWLNTGLEQPNFIQTK